jgi:two-component sensor histidine kinase
LIGSLRTAPLSSETELAGISDPTTERNWSLRSLLFFWLSFALLPIALVSILQGVERARIDTAAVHERLIESARAAASNEENILASADQILRAVGNFSEVRGMQKDCDRALVDALIGVRFFTNLARIDSTGRVVCSALPQAKDSNASSLPIFQSAKVSDGFVVSGETFSTILERPVIVAMRPVHDAQGRFDGTVSIVLDIRWLDYMLHVRDLPPGAVVAVFDQSGKVIAANDIEQAKSIFAHASTSASAQEELESGLDAKANRWAFATAPLVGNSVFVGFAMREAHLFGPTRLQAVTDFLMPIAMIALAWFGIWFATERQVTQWIIYLKRIAAAYRRGHYAVRPSLDAAPSEFRTLGDALSEMASAIQDRDRRLREVVEQKTVLIREIHHRVKNNLQIVMSLLSLQTGQLQDPAARDALLQAQVRINALALVHRILHEIEDQSTIDLKRLLEELTLQVTGGLSGEGDKLTVDTDILPREISGDLAVPLALFTVEALTNIFKHAYPNGQAPGRIFVSLREIGGGKLRLAIEDNGVGFRIDETGRSVGSRLIRTFGQQVGGVSTVKSNEGIGTVVELIFPDPTLPKNVEHKLDRAAE